MTGIGMLLCSMLRCQWPEGSVEDLDTGGGNARRAVGNAGPKAVDDGLDLTRVALDGRRDHEKHDGRRDGEDRLAVGLLGRETLNRPEEHGKLPPLLLFHNLGHQRIGLLRREVLVQQREANLLLLQEMRLHDARVAHHLVEGIAHLGRAAFLGAHCPHRRLNRMQGIHEILVLRRHLLGDLAALAHRGEEGLLLVDVVGLNEAVMIRIEVLQELFLLIGRGRHAGLLHAAQGRLEVILHTREGGRARNERERVRISDSGRPLLAAARAERLRRTRSRRMAS
mmetsp:Transcript_35180/g.110746  ORF Transcript_35180/g.110746 Transcript_35180/m.110746 type:complete len:282 (+) Transcript_35180:354-1199(+)